MAKIKQKTKRALAKRVKKTGTGALKRKHAYRSHIAHDKSTKQKRHLRKDSLIDKTDMKRIKQCLNN